MTSWTKRAAKEATRRWGGPSIYSSSASSSFFPSSFSASAGGGVGFDAGRSGAMTKNILHNNSLMKKVGTMRNGYCYNSSARSHGGWNGNGNNGNSNNGGGGGQMDIRQSLRNLFREEAKEGTKVRN